MNTTHVFVSNKSWNDKPMVIDIVNPDTGAGFYGKHTEEELRQEYPDLRTMTTDEYSELHTQSWRSAPQEISKEDYWEALECLPPVGWTHGSDNESFKMCERLSGSMTGIYARVGRRYFSMVDDITTKHEDIIAACMAAA